MNQDPNNIEYAVKLLQAGKLVAIPTETVYGLAADVQNPSAIANIYSAKERPSTNPLIIHINDASAMERYAIDIPDTAYCLAEKFWPGPLTLILKRHPNVPKIVTANQETVALRVPQHPLTLDLLKAFDGGLAAPSANRYGRISPTTAAHVRRELGDKVQLILDGGPCRIGIESTIVHLDRNHAAILRQGTIGKNDLQAVLGSDIHLSVKTHSVIQVPGSGRSHYAPEHRLYLLEQNILLNEVNKAMDIGEKLGILSFSPAPSFFTENQGSWILAQPNSSLYAQSLYGWLRMLDDENITRILVETPPNTVEWAAIIDRLLRAACN